MLKTNSKETREKIRAYIVGTFRDYDQREAEGRTFEEVARYVAEGFACEKISYDPRERAKRLYKMRESVQDIFTEWAQGLPSLIDCDYYYNVSAVKLLGDILEQTETERNKYTEEQAESLLTYLIFKELRNYIYEVI